MARIGWYGAIDGAKNTSLAGTLVDARSLQQRHSRSTGTDSSQPGIAGQRELRNNARSSMTDSAIAFSMSSPLGDNTWPRRVMIP